MWLYFMRVSPHDHRVPLNGGRPGGLEAKDDVAPLYYRLRGCAGSQAGFC